MTGLSRSYLLYLWGTRVRAETLLMTVLSRSYLLYLWGTRVQAETLLMTHPEKR